MAIAIEAIHLPSYDSIKDLLGESSVHSRRMTPSACGRERVVADSIYLALPLVCIFIVVTFFHLIQLFRSDQNVSSSPLSFY